MPAKKKTIKEKSAATSYSKKELKIFHVHEDQEQYNLLQMALLSPQEILQHLRKLINTAYGMHGYDPDKLPKKHSIKIIQRG